MPGRDVAALTGLSSQTVSVIFRALEQDGLLERGAPQRGRVGKPSVPMGLAAEGAFSFGLKIGRRSADLVLTDLAGTVRGHVQQTYRYPMPLPLIDFLRDGLAALLADLPAGSRDRVTGLGIAKPHEIWNWPDTISAPPEALSVWQQTDLAALIREITALPVYIENDATAACRAEHVFGRGKGIRNFAYFFVGALFGGGIVLNHSVFEGIHGNAGAFGPLPSRAGGGQMLDTASLYLLERALIDAGHDPQRMWAQPQDWSGFGSELDAWIEQAARELAHAAQVVCAVVDFEAVIIDGGFPADIRDRLVARVGECMDGVDMRGLVRPEIIAGDIGGNARAIGAACGPIVSQYLLNSHAGLAFA